MNETDQFDMKVMGEPAIDNLNYFQRDLKCTP